MVRVFHGAVLVVDALSVGLPHVHLAARRPSVVHVGRHALPVNLPEEYPADDHLRGRGALGDAVGAAVLDLIVGQRELPIIAHHVSIEVHHDWWWFQRVIVLACSNKVMMMMLLISFTCSEALITLSAIVFYEMRSKENPTSA